MRNMLAGLGLIVVGVIIGIAVEPYVHIAYIQAGACRLHVRVVDSDTVECGYHPRNTRLEDVYGPEVRMTKLVSRHEDGWGSIAKAELEKLLREKTLSVWPTGETDKHDRTIAAATIDGQTLVERFEPEKFVQGPDPKNWLEVICKDPVVRDRARNQHIEDLQKSLSKKEFADQSEKMTRELDKECARYITMPPPTSINPLTGAPASPN